MTEKSMKVVFDAQPLVSSQKTGVGHYTEGLIKALSARPDVELVGHYWQRPGGRAVLLPQSPNLSYVKSAWVSGLVYRLLRKCGIRLPREIFIRQKADVLLFPNFTSHPGLAKIPCVVVIHDLAFLDCQQFVRRANLRFLKRYVPRDVHKASLVLSVSRFTKDRLVKDLNIPSDRILVTSIPPAAPTAARKSSGLPKNFILFISTIEPRKNLGGLVNAYALLPKVHREKYSLVIAGGSGWDSDLVLSRIDELQHLGYDIRLMGYVDEQTRASLYSSAETVVVPSFYEGFGMPILEAMSYGAPTAVSDIQVFREVAGDASLYFDPTKPESIRDSLVKMLDNRSLRQNLAKRSSRQLALYDWSKVSDDVYKAMLGLVKHG